MEAFALFNVFYQAGILAGPLVGLAFAAVDFRLTAACAAAVFAVLTIAQLFALPQHDSEPTGTRRRSCRTGAPSCPTGPSCSSPWR